MYPEYYISLQAPEANSPNAAIDILHKKLDHYLNNCYKNTPPPAILLRFFCGDVHRHAPLIERLWPQSQNSQKIYIGQTPADSAYISLQVYGISTVAPELAGPGAILVRHGKYKSLWTLDYPASIGDSETQSEEIIISLKSHIAHAGMDIEKNLVRTWYYLRDIDNNYAGMIKARVKMYEQAGLKPDSHFVASTGIQGNSPWQHALVGLHAHCTEGLATGQIHYLKALSHLCPTHDYGVNFERATKIVYGDRAHCHISGTASIDAQGEILHPGNVTRQCERALENISALLQEGDFSISNLKCITIYLRDIWDYRAVKDVIANYLPHDCAVNYTHAPVCRPDWLIEIEGEAIMPANTAFAAFC